MGSATVKGVASAGQEDENGQVRCNGKTKRPKKWIHFSKKA
jgi:hypothetical protein